jgi:hypothetical protein
MLHIHLVSGQEGDVSRGFIAPFVKNIVRDCNLFVTSNNHTAWHCCLPQTISNLKTWRPWLLFTGQLNINYEFIPRITGRNCYNVILFEVSTSECLWSHEMCSKCELLSSLSCILQQSVQRWQHLAIRLHGIASLNM